MSYERMIKNFLKDEYHYNIKRGLNNYKQATRKGRIHKQIFNDAVRKRRF